SGSGRTACRADRSAGERESAPARRRRPAPTARGGRQAPERPPHDPRMLVERILTIILPVFITIALGYGYGRWRGESVRAEMVPLNRINIDVLCPLLVLTAFASKDFDLANNTGLMAAGALISLGSGVLAWPVARLLHYDVRSFVPAMMYNNCGNMGLPLAVLAFGPSGLSAAVALFMAGSLVYFTAGIRIVGSGR